MNPVQIQEFGNITGTLDLFTGIFYVIRVFSLGHGSIQPTEDGDFILEQNIFSASFETSNLWYFEEAPTHGQYQWKSASQPNSAVTWDSSEVPSGEEEDNSVELKSYPLILQNTTADDGISQLHESFPENSFWSFEPRSLMEFGKQGMGFAIKSQHSLQGNVTVTLGAESLKGWWLQVDEESPSSADSKNSDCDDECLRSKSNSILILEPTNFSLHGDSNHMDIGEIPDLLQKVKFTKSYLSSSKMILNPTGILQSVNVTMDTLVEYNVYVEPNPEHRFLSTLQIHNPKTNPSSKYFDFENDPSYDGKGMILQATSYVKSTEEFEVEPASTKNISAYITYMEEMVGIPYSSWTNVSAQIDMMTRADDKGQDARGIKSVWVHNPALLKHLLRSRGYQGRIKEVETAPGEPTKVAIKIRGSLRGKLPIPTVQFEEGPSSPLYVPGKSKIQQNQKETVVEKQFLS